MIDTRAGLLLALSSLAICAEAKGRGGGGTSGSGSGIDLGIGGKDIAIMVTAVIFTIIFFSQFFRSFKLFSARPYEEEIPLRKPFGALILGATTSLTVYHALRAVTATSASPRWTAFPDAIFVVQLAFSKLIDIFSVAAVFLMVAHRRKFFLQETCLYEMGGKQRIFYIILPIVYLVAMIATAAATTGLYARVMLEKTFIPSPMFYKGYDATQHVYLTAYLLLVITTVTSAYRLVSDIDLGLAGSYPYNHKNVFSRVAKVMCTVLALQGLLALIVHLIFYLPVSRNSGYSRFGLAICEMIISGLFFIVLMGTAINLGRLPKDAKPESGPDTIEAGASTTRIFIFKQG